MERIYPELSGRFAELLRALENQHVVVLGHARPDGDCIGSQVGLARVLRALGIDAVCANADPVPRRLQFIVADTPFVGFDALPADYTTAIYVDCADQARAGERFKARFPQPFANIDHHLSNASYAAHNFIDVGSAATGEILAGLFIDNHLAVDAPAAQGLYVGMMTDTGQFRFDSTSQRTFHIAAELMSRGAQPAVAGGELYERESLGKMKLLERFLASLTPECAGRVCIGVLPDGVFEATGTTAEDTEGLVDYARSIEGVEIGVLIEERGRAVKASLRGKDPAYRVDRIAAQFNGGGHACAAGLNLKNVDPLVFRAELIAALSAQIDLVARLKQIS